MDTGGSFTRGNRSWGMKLTTHFHLVPKFKMHRALYELPHACSGCDALAKNNFTSSLLIPQHKWNYLMEKEHRSSAWSKQNIHIYKTSAELPLHSLRACMPLQRQDAEAHDSLAKSSIP
jgi:hypothetical protein